jgi:hypothetical protein
MKAQLSSQKLSGLKLASSLFITMLFMVGCTDDPKPTNEEELITTLQVTLVPQSGGTTVTLEFYDEDGDGSIDPIYTYSPSVGTGDNVAAQLSANTTYNATIILLNETSNPAVDITSEIEEEAEDHIFCFAVTGANLTVTNRNLDANSLPVGLTSTWTTTAASSGTINLKLRHQPETKNGECPGTGDTDIDVTFKVQIQ